MRKLIICFVVLSFSLQSFAQQYFVYTATGRKEYFKVRKDMMLITAKSDQSANNLLKQAVFDSVYVQIGKQLIVIVDSIKIKMADIEQNKDISGMSYILEYDHVLHAADDVVFVKCKKDKKIDQVIDMVGLREHIDHIELINEISQIYSVTFDAPRNTLFIAQQLYETGLCEFAEPSFMRFMMPSNPYYQQQWGLKNTGQYGGISGYDIKIQGAWGITKGSNNIRIAVIDEGVDLNHPDLSANLVVGYDAVTGNYSNGGSAEGNDYHGTACAGIIGAADNNIGIVGIAPNCEIIPIRIAYWWTGGGENRWVTNDSWIIDGIHKAWADFNADVINNSWTGGYHSETMKREIQDATIYGRDSLGCVVVFSAGNHNTALPFPSSLDEVIAVGAISQCGTRKRSSSDRYDAIPAQPDPAGVSCDGEKTWGSNFGEGLDVVAPGVRIYTTDIHGSAGVNKSAGTAGDYFANFSGTSAAAPFVSGIAALILSVRPDLTQTQVRHLIESTCTKLPSYVYSTNLNQPNGTWNNEVGHGLVNAYQAVVSVAPRLTGPSTICPSATYSVLNIPDGAGVTWSYSSNLRVQSSGGGGLIGGITLDTTFIGGNTIIFEPNPPANNNTIVLQKNTLSIPLITPVYPLPPISTYSPTITEGWVQATIIIGNQTTTLRQSVTVGSPQGRITGPIPMNSHYVIIPQAPGNYKFVAHDVPAEVQNIRWLIGHKSGQCSQQDSVTSLYFGREITARLGNGITDIQMQWVGSCGNSVPTSLQLGIYCDGCGDNPGGPGVILYSVSPNPTSSTLNFTLNDNIETQSTKMGGNRVQSERTQGECSVQLLSTTTGVIVYRQKVSNFETDFSINVSSIPNGLYLLQLIRGNEMIQVQNILVQH